MKYITLIILCFFTFGFKRPMKTRWAPSTTVKYYYCKEFKKYSLKVLKEPFNTWQKPLKGIIKLKFGGFKDVFRGHGIHICPDPDWNRPSNVTAYAITRNSWGIYSGNLTISRIYFNTRSYRWRKNPRF